MRKNTDHTNSDWDIVHLDHIRQIVYIHDLNLGNRSVTNDAENVVDDLDSQYPGWRIIYKDSMDSWAELVHKHNEFMGFDFIDGATVPPQAK